MHAAYPEVATMLPHDPSSTNAITPTSSGGRVTGSIEFITESGRRGLCDFAVYGADDPLGVHGHVYYEVCATENDPPRYAVVEITAFACRGTAAVVSGRITERYGLWDDCTSATVTVVDEGTPGAEGDQITLRASPSSPAGGSDDAAPLLTITRGNLILHPPRRSPQECDVRSRGLRTSGPSL